MGGASRHNSQIMEVESSRLVFSLYVFTDVNAYVNIDVCYAKPLRTIEI